MEKVIKMNLGIGMNMLFPEPVTIVIESFEERYEKYREFCKTIEEPDYDFFVDDPNQNKVRLLTLDEFIDTWHTSTTFQEKFKINEDEI